MGKPRHVELERRLVAEGWVRDRRGEYGVEPSVTVMWTKSFRDPGKWGEWQTQVPQRPKWAGYDRRCDQVLVDMATARGETWADAIRRAEKAEAEVERLREELAEERMHRRYSEDHAEVYLAEARQLRRVAEGSECGDHRRRDRRENATMRDEKANLPRCPDCGTRMVMSGERDERRWWEVVQGIQVHIPASFELCTCLTCGDECLGPAESAALTSLAKASIIAAAGHVHGSEAEELRCGIEQLASRYEDEALREFDGDEVAAELHRLLDRVDAHDSLAFLESRDKTDAEPPGDGLVAEGTGPTREGLKTMSRSTLAEMRENSDWQQAMDFAGQEGHPVLQCDDVDQKGITFDDVLAVVCADAGENDGDPWLAVFLCQDGRFAYLAAGCNFTGWECRADGDVRFTTTWNDMVKLGLDDEARERLLGLGS